MVDFTLTLELEGNGRASREKCAMRVGSPRRKLRFFNLLVFTLLCMEFYFDLLGIVLGIKFHQIKKGLEFLPNPLILFLVIPPGIEPGLPA